MRFRPTRFSLFCFLTIRITVEKGEIHENSGTIVSQSSHGLPFATIDRSNLELLGVCVSRACSIFNPNCLLNEQARWRGEGGGRKGREKILKKRVRNAFRAFFFFKAAPLVLLILLFGVEKKNEHFLRKRSYLFLFFTTNKRNSDLRGVSFGVLF